MHDEYMNLSEAARVANVADHVLLRLVKRGELATFTNPLDRREALVRRSDLDTLRQPTPRTGYGVSTNSEASQAA